MTKPVLYTGSSCPKCLQVKEMLSREGLLAAVTHQSIEDPSGLADAAFNDVFTVPTLLVGGRHVTDAKEIVGWLRKNTPASGVESLSNTALPGTVSVSVAPA